MKKEYSILKEIKRLKSIRGYGTELVSIYIPAGFQLSDEVARLRSEHSESANIKSKSVRTNVQSAIDKIMQYLKLYKETPKNGLAVFAGNISRNPGKVDIELFSMEPPIPLKINIYRCDSTFLLDPIEEVVEAKDVYALLVLDGREATVATLKGTHIQVIKKMNSMVHAKVRKGGQSAQRYARGIEESIGEYHKRVAEVINSTFMKGDFKLKGLIVGGPGPTKEGFVKSNELNYQIKVLGVFDIGYTDEFGLQELMEKSAELLKEQEAGQERKILERFMQEISRGGLAVRGYKDTKNALEKNQISTLIISKDIEIQLAKRVCDKCGKESLIFVEKSVEESVSEFDKRKDAIKNNTDPADARTHEGHGVFKTVEMVDGIEMLIDMADSKGADTIFVSSESSLGKQFLMGFQGIGAILRYKG